MREKYNSLMYIRKYMLSNINLFNFIKGLSSIFEYSLTQLNNNAMNDFNKYDANALDALDKLKDAGIDVHDVGRSYYGGLPSIDKTILNSRIDEKVSSGELTPSEASDLKHEVSFTGSMDESSIDYDDSSIDFDDSSIDIDDDGGLIEEIASFIGSLFG